jgi:hypothetical protein
MKGFGEGQFESGIFACEFTCKKRRGGRGRNTQKAKSRQTQSFVGHFAGFSPPPPLLQPIRLFGIIN